MLVDDAAFEPVDGVSLVDEMASDDDWKLLGMGHVSDRDVVSLVVELDHALVDFGHHGAACSKGATNVKYKMTGSQRTKKHTSQTKVSLTERTSSGALV